MTQNRLVTFSSRSNFPGIGLALVLLASSMCFARPADWTRITEINDSNIQEPALARTADGVLHVVWTRKNGPKRDLLHTGISKDGKFVGPPTLIIDAWETLDNPDLVVTKDGGLRLFISGQHTTDIKDPHSHGALTSATAPESGAPWKLEKGVHSQSNAVTASPVGAAVMADGTPIAAWAVSFALQAHIGLDPKKDDLKFQTTCCAYQPDIAVDAASGEAILGWYSNANNEQGLYTQAIAPNMGEKQFVPDSATADRKSSLSIDQRMAITNRIGAPGIYVAYGAGYPTYQTVNLWRHGTVTPIVVAKASGARRINISAGPEGRLWVMWERNRRIYATRSNRDATRFGSIVEVSPPAGKAESGVYKVKGEGSVWPLDLFVACQSIKELATYHAQVFPGLSLTASPASVLSAKGGTVTFLVSDAGDPVSGASVSVAGKSFTTDAQGRASYVVPKGAKVGSISATASKSDYTPASTSVAVK
ncbi:MAG: hypothetical protein HY508_11430 [Acidobacteria bacterium]|nr:hypothetical protein [Acidobacteriota bacterium]